MILVPVLAVVVPLAFTFGIWFPVRHPKSKQFKLFRLVRSPRPPAICCTSKPKPARLSLAPRLHFKQHPSTLTIYNESGSDLIDIPVNLRGFFFRTENDEPGPTFSNGHPSMEPATNSWWYVPSLAAGKKITKDAKDILDNYLHNAGVF